MPPNDDALEYYRRAMMAELGVTRDRLDWNNVRISVASPIREPEFVRMRSEYPTTSIEAMTTRTVRDARRLYRQSKPPKRFTHYYKFPLVIDKNNPRHVLTADGKDALMFAPNIPLKQVEYCVMTLNDPRKRLIQEELRYDRCPGVFEAVYFKDSFRNWEDGGLLCWIEGEERLRKYPYWLGYEKTELVQSLFVKWIVKTLGKITPEDLEKLKRSKKYELRKWIQRERLVRSHSPFMGVQGTPLLQDPNRFQLFINT